MKKKKYPLAASFENTTKPRKVGDRFRIGTHLNAPPPPPKIKIVSKFNLLLRKFHSLKYS